MRVLYLFIIEKLKKNIRKAWFSPPSTNGEENQKGKWEGIGKEKGKGMEKWGKKVKEREKGR